MSGEGEVFAVPDTATFTVTVQDTAADVQTAQTKATNEGNAIIDYLKAQGIADTDIQTTDYEINSAIFIQPGGVPERPHPGEWRRNPRYRDLLSARQTNTHRLPGFRNA